MKVIHRGLGIDLGDDDPRVAIIEAVLFGKTLPPPLPPPEESRVEVEKSAAPEETVPAHWLRFWSTLDEDERAELELLSRGSFTAGELQKETGLAPSSLRPQHMLIHRKARTHLVSLRIRTTGRYSHNRRYLLDEEPAAQLRALVRHLQTKTEETP